MTDSSDPFDVLGVSLMTDDELAERRRHLVRLERTQFHDTLSPLTFIGTAGHLINPRLDDARWAVEKEMRRRGSWPPVDDQSPG